MEGAEIIEKMEEQNNRNLEEVTFKRKNDRPEVNASKQKDSSQKKSVIDDRKSKSSKNQDRVSNKAYEHYEFEDNQSESSSFSRFSLGSSSKREVGKISRRRNHKEE